MTLRLLIFTFLFSLLLLLSGTSAPYQALHLPHEKYTLPNGLEVILQEDSSAPSVAISVWYHVGSVNEDPSKTGFAHLFEHLMFEDSLHTHNYIKTLESIGASEFNGTTSFDRTNYYEVVPSNELELVLWLESDRMGFLLEAMTKEKLDEQRAVVKNERRQTLENAPYGIVSYDFWQKVFPKNHPYFGQPIGSMADLDRASLQDVSDFFRRYYSPANATLTIVGNFNTATIRSLIQKYFGELKGPPKASPLSLQMPFINKELIIHETEKIGKLPFISILYMSPPVFTQGDTELDLIAYLLTGDKTSRLKKALLYEQPLAQKVEASESSLLYGSTFSIDVIVREGVHPEKVLAIITEQIESLITHPPSQKDLDRIIALLTTQRLFGLQKIGGRTGRTEQLQTYNHYLGTPDFLEGDLQRYKKVRPEDIVEAVKTYLPSYKRAVLIATPEKDTK